MNRIAAWALAAVMALNAAHSTTNHTTNNNTTTTRVPVHQQVQTALRAEIDYNKEDEPMKKSVYTILMAAMCAASLTLTGCGGDGGEDAAVTTTTTTNTTAIATTTTTTDSAETTYITVTGEDGAAVTDADGAAVTSAIAIDPTTTATDAATTAADTTTTTTTTTAAWVAITTQAPPATTVETSTTAAPTTTTTAGRVPNYDDPWTWPCDWQGMEADCKAYVESQGWTWDANLNVDKGSWDGKRHTVWNELWENYNVLEDSIKQDISFYAGQGDTYFKCVFIPDEEYDGHYHIYIVHGSGPTPADLPEGSLNPNFTDLAKKAVN